MIQMTHITLNKNYNDKGIWNAYNFDLQCQRETVILLSKANNCTTRKPRAGFPQSAHPKPICSLAFGQRELPLVSFLWPMGLPLSPVSKRECGCMCYPFCFYFPFGRNSTGLLAVLSDFWLKQGRQEIRPKLIQQPLDPVTSKLFGKPV